MKTKKATVWAAVISVAVVVIIIAVFATSAITERDEQKSMYIVTGEDTSSANISSNAGQTDNSVPMSSSESISDNTGIPNADDDIFDIEIETGTDGIERIGISEYTGEIEGTNISEYVDKYVALTNDTEIERWEMLNHNGENILRIRVGYHQDDLRGTIQGHKEDYFIFINGDQESVLQVGYEDKDIGMACSYDAVFEDVTFDGNDDLLIWMGDFGPSSIYCAFIYENGQYRYEESFENIPSYRVDTKNHVISGTSRNSATSHTYYTYEYQNGEFVEVEERTIELEYQDGVYFENEYINGTLISTKEVEYDG